MGNFPLRGAVSLWGSIFLEPITIINWGMPAYEY
jgi:hypothetical protein